MEIITEVGLSNYALVVVYIALFILATFSVKQ